ncbi:MAG TPA: surface-adhesin E family protein [Candidatus Binatia bacterium]|nr:surface-adhesin E family protein [Candidatus Binatia bacterium]
MKKGLLIFAAVLTLVLLVGVAAIAANEWRQIGSTTAGDTVLVSAISAQRHGLRTAWVRVEYKEPTKLPQGGPFVELRARVRFNCAGSNAGAGLTANSEWFYSRDHSGKLVVSKKSRRDDQFGQPSEGDFAGLARDFVCKQK